MGIAEETADKLAAAVIAHIEATGDEDIITLISKSLGDSSQTLQEAFVTSVRVQRAAIRANQMLAARAEEIARRPADEPAKPAAAPQPTIPPEPEAEAEHEQAASPEADAEAAEATEAEAPKTTRAAQRARELLERRKAEREAAEEARRAEADGAARRGRRAVPEVKSDPRLG
ncbi:hypothetical protein [Jannaschia seohaensis]|uniref:Uncharacterized protein n=1 Tax=Jannaschia seohaensis TaxID=475081 RepID=A0A2Y9AUD8_9RHOB|nr:hypothetical protein [Jannaschia seohaensis]PWJ19197.1 hypothetical protein BCF38_104128 [Jannaschia seohaensis]SSA45859.1 hypothetical protein SAMN05421539_104128 [Jannaschia seohaensis]